MVSTFIRRNLGSKMMASIIASLLIVIGIESTIRIYFRRLDLIKVIEAMATDLAVLTYAGIEYPMSVGDSQAVVNVLASVRERMRGIEVFICDTKQEITWSTDPEKTKAQIAQTISDRDARETLTKILQTGAPPDHNLIDIVGGERCIIVILPVFNKHSCHQCHDARKYILGGIVVRTNAEQNFQEINASIARTIAITVMGIVGIITISFLMLRRFILRPVMNLTGAVKRISEGDLDFEIQCESGDEIGILATSFNQMTRDLKNARDEINRWTETLEDLVEERTEQLKRAQENAIRTEKMASLGRLAAIVAHEINNPLAGIRTYAKLIAKKSADMIPCVGEKYLEHIKTIESESARCGEIVRNLLQFARPSKPMVSKQDVNQLINDSIQLVQHKLDLLTVELRLTLHPGPLEVYCDCQKIKQALVALLLNACEAVQPELGILEVKSRPVLERNGIEFSIRDNGIGMDEETRVHMFEPFFTTKTKPEEDETGMNIGLGVSVVYEIIKSHRGEIMVESEIGEGTTIAIFLPREPAETET